MATEHVWYKDFGRHVLPVSRQIKQASVARAERQGRVIQYVRSSRVSKEEMARRIATEQNITQGLVCVLSSVEPCYTFDIYRDRSSRRLQLVQRNASARTCINTGFTPRWDFCLRASRLGFRSASKSA